MSEQKLWAVYVIGIDEHVAARSLSEAKREIDYLNQLNRKHTLWQGADVVEWPYGEEAHLKRILWDKIYLQIAEQAIHDGHRQIQGYWNSFFVHMFLSGYTRQLMSVISDVKVELPLDELRDYMRKVELYAASNLNVTFEW